MKKIIFASIGLTMLVGAVQAQNYPPPRRYPPPRQYPAPQQQQQVKKKKDDFYKVKFGVIAGANFANIIKPTDASFHTDTRIGLNLGLSLEVPVAKPLTFEAELAYSEKGYTADYTNGDSFTQRNNFIDMPLLAKFRLAPWLSLVVGPQVSFLVSTQNVYTSGLTSTVIQDQYNQDAQGYDKALLDGVIGLSLHLSRNIELRGRYTVDLQSNAAYSASTNPQYNNQAVQVGLGFKF